MKAVGVSGLLVLVAVASGAVEVQTASGAIGVQAGQQLKVTAGGAVLVAAQDPEGCCQSVEKSQFCRNCKKLRGEGDVEEFQSPKSAFKACKECTEANGGGLQGALRAWCREVDVCVRKYHQCEGCGKTGVKPEACTETDKCEGKDMVERTDRARIEYVCEECGMKRDQPWDRPHNSWQNKGEVCKGSGEPLKKVCTGKGKFPHTE